MTMELKIFDVEHGACALLTCDDTTRLMIDAGHNANGQWWPGQYLRDNNISYLDMLAITNYDEDHVSGVNDLFGKVDVGWLSRNPSVSRSILSTIKQQSGGMGPGITALCDAIENKFTGDGTSPQPTFSGMIHNFYWNTYPAFTDTNNLSFASFLNCHGIGVMFTGDLEKLGWEALAGDSNFRSAMQNTNLLIAPHHGRIKEEDRDFYRDFYKIYFPNIFYVVISDKGYQFDTQQTIPLYREIARGGPFRNEGERRVLTTRNDGRIGFNFQLGSWGPF